MKKIFISGVVVFLFAQMTSLAQADKVYLTTGEVKEGKISEQDDVAVTIMIGQTPLRFYRAQIERIELDDPSLTVVFPEGFKLEELPNIAEKKIRLIFKFMELSGVRKNVEDQVSELIANAPAGREVEFRAIFRVNELFKVLIPIYDSHYSEQELREMIKFYESPVGKKVIETTPVLVEEIMQKMAEYIKSLTAMPTI